MTVRNYGRLIFAAGLIATVAGCQEGTSPFGAAKSPPAEATDAAESGTGIAPEGALTLVARDVEAPDVFSLTDKGLWDGRPSLGGVWVAHSTVTDPQRVIIRNPANGSSVIGALFRREAANPGPSVQISSDAAAALEILAGSPAEISIVALRREEPEAPPAPAATEVTDATETDLADDAEPAAAEGTTDALAATAAAAIDEAEGITAATVETAADGSVITADAAAETASEAAPKKRKGLFGGLFGKKQAAEAPLDATAPAEVASAPGSPEVGAPIPGGTIGGGAIATTPLPAASTAPAASGGLDRAYVQIGIFSVQANAQRAADQMKAAGMTATVKSDQSNGKSFWRVIVGPAASAGERDALAARVKGIGYPDAYPVKG